MFDWLNTVGEGVRDGIHTVIFLLKLFLVLCAFVSALLAWKFMLAQPAKWLFGIKPGVPNSELVEGVLSGLRMLVWAVLIGSGVWLAIHWG